MSPPGAAAGPSPRRRRLSDTAVVPVSIEGHSSERVTVTPAMAQRWYTAQPRGERRGPVMGFDIEDCAAQAAVTARLGRRSIWYRRVDRWRFEAGPLVRGRQLDGCKGTVGDPPEDCAGVEECAQTVTVRLAGHRAGPDRGLGGAGL